MSLGAGAKEIVTALLLVVVLEFKPVFEDEDDDEDE